MESTLITGANIQEFNGTEAEYHAKKDHMSASALKRIKVSPLHYKEEPPMKESEALLFGSAYHCYMLEPERFEKEYYVFDDEAKVNELLGEGFKSPRSTKDYKEWYQTEMHKANGMTTISKTDATRLKDMRNRIMGHRYVRDLLSGGIAEQAFMGELHTDAGPIKVKIKPDYHNPTKRFIVDLKTCMDASLNGFSRHAADLDYHLQAAFYSDVLELHKGGFKRYTFIFIAQEKTWPYAFNIFEPSPQFIGQGRYEYEKLLRLYKQCLDQEDWPSYQVWVENKFGIVDFNLPPWSIKELNFFNHGK